MTAMDFEVQHYRRKQMLTWWEGKHDTGRGVGEYVIFDDTYREIERILASKGCHWRALQQALFSFVGVG